MLGVHVCYGPVVSGRQGFATFPPASDSYSLSILSSGFPEPWGRKRFDTDVPFMAVLWPVVNLGQGMRAVSTHGYKDNYLEGTLILYPFNKLIVVGFLPALMTSPAIGFYLCLHTRYEFIPVEQPLNPSRKWFLTHIPFIPPLCQQAHHGHYCILCWGAIGSWWLLGERESALFWGMGLGRLVAHAVVNGYTLLNIWVALIEFTE